MQKLALILLVAIFCWADGSFATEPLPVESASTPTAPPAASAAATPAAHARAGHPLSVAPWARHTYDSKYSGYLVGGGKVPTKYPKRISAEPPFTDEGTWAIDYTPWWSRVNLLWSHGQLYQGGAGQYEPDHKNNPFDQRFGRKLERAE